MHIDVEIEQFEITVGVFYSTACTVLWNELLRLIVLSRLRFIFLTMLYIFHELILSIMLDKNLNKIVFN